MPIKNIKVGQIYRCYDGKLVIIKSLNDTTMKNYPVKANIVGRPTIIRLYTMEGIYETNLLVLHQFNLKELIQDIDGTALLVGTLKEVSQAMTSQTNQTSNNGGKTSYYDLPIPSRKKIVEILNEHLRYLNETDMLHLVESIFQAFPDTLNDLIESKQMEFWRGDAFKALYGLEGRILKSGKDEVSAELRELNKVVYYCNRRIASLTKEKKDGN